MSEYKFNVLEWMGLGFIGGVEIIVLLFLALLVAACLAGVFLFTRKKS